MTDPAADPQLRSDLATAASMLEETADRMESGLWKRTTYEMTARNLRAWAYRIEQRRQRETDR